MKPPFFKLIPSHSACLSLSIAIGSIGWLAPVNAKELYFQPSVNVQTEYDDNKILRPEGSFSGIDLSSYGVIATAGANIGARSDRYNVMLKNQVVVNRYESELDLDSDNFNINLNSNYSLTEKSQVSLDASYLFDTTLTSELDGTGSGLVQGNIRRKQWSVTPTWNYSLSNTQSFQFSYMHLETDYENTPTGNFSNYTIDNFSTSFQQQWTPLMSSFLSVSAMSFKIPELGSSSANFKISQEITEYSVTLGGNYQITPTWMADFNIGSRFSNTEITQTILPNSPFERTTTSSSDVRGLIFAVGVDKTFEAGKASINFSRSTNPQGQGRLQVRDNIDVHFYHKFTQRIQGTLRGSFNDISTSGSVDDGNARTYYDIKPSIKWNIDRQASITAGYRYRSQKFDSRNDGAVSNSVSLNFNYQWDKIVTQKY